MRCAAICRPDTRHRYWADRVFALAGFVGHTDWPQILMSSIWVPLVLLFFLRAVRGHAPAASAALCGAALGMAFLSGHHVVPTFTAVLLGALWLVYVALGGTGLPACLLRVRHAAIFVAVWLLVSAVQVLPAIEYAKQSLRWAGAPEPLRWGQPVPYDVHAHYSLGWPSVGGIVWPGISLHANPHVGFVAIALALAALWYRRRDACVRWLALGGARRSAAGARQGLPGILADLPLRAHGGEGARTGHGDRALSGGHRRAGRPGRGCVPSRMARLRGSAVLALALFLGEAVYDAPHLGRFDRPGSYTATIRGQSDIAQFLKAQPGWFRVDFDDNDVSYNFGNLYAIEQFGGVGSSLPVRTHRMLGNAETPRLFGIRYRVARKPSNPAQEEVFRSRSGLSVFRDPRIDDPLWTWRDAPCAAPDRLRVISRVPDVFVVEADLACPGAGGRWRRILSRMARLGRRSAPSGAGIGRGAGGACGRRAPHHRVPLSSGVGVLGLRIDDAGLPGGGLLQLS